ncbi:aminoacyl-tRNA hydrolase [Candidatus Mycoplasma haematominutum]|uniref:Peptidyl-tRNA hydrolase n=1 Tax=Candidatus Mycoplasma haematominutum 'Birmingham 1' TaxID=1116213 RepID=G8C2Y1_9MOLU|nr:aminoacyl-tRNA hydrolase [Candidatus Mycoplasma haematominutum]CCE66679.1 peptidyl-tRNA hydrolase [Candidatus Mycoplasma haematominutum 'Birmingham 1']
MKIIVGLGNPGLEYERTRHNLGFYFVDRFLEERGCTPFSPLLGSQVSLNNSLASYKFLLCKPFEFMNDSGKTLRRIIDQLKIPVDNVLIIYDELDVSLGKLKVTKRRETQISHRGVKDITLHFPEAVFLKIKVGIGPEYRKNLVIKKYVMEKFTLSEWGVISELEREIFQLFEKFIQLPDKLLSDPINYLLRK